MLVGCEYSFMQLAGTRAGGCRAGHVSHPGWMLLGDGAWAGWIGRFQSQCPLWATLVVVLHGDAQDPIEMPLPNDQQADDFCDRQQ